jgi:glucose-6-phosphate 1-dehydrogenase
MTSATHTKAADPTPAGPCTIVIFGASGDLTKRKLIPALYHLSHDGLLPANFAIVGIGRGDTDDEEFREKIGAEAKELTPGGVAAKTWNALAKRIYFVAGNFDDPTLYAALTTKLAEVEKAHGTGGNVLFYLSTAPDYFGKITAALSKAGLTKETAGRWRRVVVEKPFGRDLASAKALNAELRSELDERQIYRIDHYLGKETVQNLLVFRFANGIFEPVWNRRYVDHVQITVAETLGVEKRGGYYDGTGALRDMVPNHIFQLISLTAMEPPISFDADAVRDEQTKVLKAMTRFTPEDVLQRTVRGQYGAGTVGGAALPDYRAEANVAPASNTETYVAMKLGVDNWRWMGVPFYLRVGKALADRSTEVVIQFKAPPFILFRNTGVESLKPNRLVIRIQPEESISLEFGAKEPGATVRIAGVDMDFRYTDHFGSHPATGYERLLHDAMLGDQTLFQRADMVEASWTVVDPILDIWKALPERRFPNYAAGTMGPADADALLAKDGRTWTPTTKA